jgi:hypothetical protein
MAGPLDDIFQTSSTAAAPVASGPLDDIFGVQSQAAPVEVPGMAPGLLRSGAHGATLGFGDELEAFIRARLGSGTYDQNVKSIRDSQKAFDAKHPILSTVAEVGGALPTAFVPGMGGITLARAAGQGARAVAHASGKVGAAQGLASGFGKGEGDVRTAEGLTNRVGNAAAHAALGYPFGAAGGVAAHGIAKGLGNTLQFGSDIVREGSDAGVNAIRAANRAALADGTSPDAMLAAILPKHRTVTADDMTQALMDYGTAIEKNQTAGDATKIAAQTLIRLAQARGQTLNPKTAADQAKLIVGRYNEMHRVPMQLHELPALREGSRGTESSWTMRAAMNRASDEADGFRTALTERQAGLGDEMIGALERGIGAKSSGDDMLIKAREALKTRNRATYKAAEDADEAARIAIGRAPGTAPPGAPGNLPAVVPGVSPIDLSREISTMHLRHQGRQGATSKGMIEAVEALTEEMPTGPTTLRQWLDVKQRLDDMITASQKEPLVPGGAPQATDLTRQLLKFKNELMTSVGKSNPLYAKANAEAAKGFDEIRVAQLARKIGTTMNSQTRSAMREFDKAPKEAQQMARIMWAQNVVDMVLRKGETHDVSKIFGTKGAREIAEHMLGPKAAKTFLDHVQRISIASRSHQSLGGSQTAPLLQRFKDADLSEKIRQAMSFMNPMGAVRGIGEYVARSVNAKRDGKLLEHYGISTAEPHKLIDALQRMQAQQNNMKLLPGPVRNPSPFVAPFAAIGGQRVND